MPLSAGRLHGERDAEVGDERLPVVQQDVLGLDVAMDHAVRGARSRARSATSRGDAHRVGDRQLPFARRAGSRSDSPVTTGMT